MGTSSAITHLYKQDGVITSDGDYQLRGDLIVTGNMSVGSTSSILASIDDITGNSSYPLL